MWIYWRENETKGVEKKHFFSFYPKIRQVCFMSLERKKEIESKDIQSGRSKSKGKTHVINNNITCVCQ